MVLGNTIEFTHMALGLVPEILDAINVVLLVGEQFGVIDSKVLELGNIEHVIASPAIRIDDAVWNDLVFYDRV